MRLLLVLLTQWEIHGKENVPENGPLIVVANHLNFVDPPLLSASIPRRITFMAKEELFRSRGRAVVRAFGAFPVRRGKLDRQAIRQAMRVIEHNHVLGLFPEGKRSQNHEIGEAEFGVAFIALRSGAPVLPIGISGSENIKGLRSIIRRPSVTVTIGQSFAFDREEGKISKERLGQVTDIIMGHIAKILPTSYRGLYDK